MTDTKVKTHPLCKVPDEKIKYVVICARCGDQLLLCRHHDRDTWEFPGGHREADETVLSAAKRELYEETGALSFDISPVCAYSEVSGRDVAYGVYYIADVHERGELPKSGIAETKLFDDLPDNLTYPRVQAKLFVISSRIKIYKNISETISLRRALTADVQDIIRLYHPNYVPTGKSNPDDIIRIEEEFQVRTTENALRTTIEKKNHRIFVAHDNTTAIAVCRVHLIPRTNTNGETYIDGGIVEPIYVLESHRNAEIGRRLTEHAQNYMRKRGVTNATLWISAADEYLLDCAETQGFVFDGTREMTDSGTRMRYRKTL